MRVVDITELKILDDANYTFTANCFEQSLSFVVTWVERLKKRFITVRGSNGDVYLQNTAINIDEPLSFNINARNADYDCKMLLQHMANVDTTVDYLNWSRNMFLTVYRITQE